MNDTTHSARTIRAPRGRSISARSWLTEAPLRMIMNNLDPEVAERPADLVVYGGIGRAARNWECFDRIVESLPLTQKRSPQVVMRVGIVRPQAQRFLEAGLRLGKLVQSVPN